MRFKNHIKNEDSAKFITLLQRNLTTVENMDKGVVMLQCDYIRGFNAKPKGKNPNV